MKLRSLTVLLLLLIAACSGVGSTTTRRPVLDRPAIEPDGTFWDAVTAMQDNNPARFRFLLSTRFIHQAILPEAKRNDTTNEETYDLEKTRQLDDLKPYAGVEKRLVEGYLALFRERIRESFVQTSQPAYNIRYKGEFGAAKGPNTAKVTVTFVPKTIQAKPDGSAAESQSLVVSFVQEYDAWCIDGFDPDPLKGAFSR